MILSRIHYITLFYSSISDGKSYTRPMLDDASVLMYPRDCHYK